MAVTKPDVSLSWAMIKGIPVDTALWTQFCFVVISVVSCLAFCSSGHDTASHRQEGAAFICQSMPPGMRRHGILMQCLQSRQTWSLERSPVSKEYRPQKIAAEH